MMLLAFEENSKLIMGRKGRTSLIVYIVTSLLCDLFSLYRLKIFGANPEFIKDCERLIEATTDAVSKVTIPWVETEAVPGFRIWHLMLLCFSSLLTIIIVLCCCIRFRIPRTKQEIEADYIRKRITRKFEKQLRLIHNADMDEMDLKRALDRIRAEFKSDTESLAQSDALSGATLSSCNMNHDTYRKASDIGVSFDDLLEKQKLGNKKFPSFAGMIAKFRTSKRPILVKE